MSVQVARRVLLDRLGAGRVALLAVLLDLPSIPVWADGGTQDGRALVLVGRHGLGPAPDAEEVVQIVLEQLHRGVVPPGVHDVAYLPQASQAIAEAVDSERCWCGGEPVNGTHAHTEICAWGGRGSGKTQMAAGALAVLGEQHRRRGYPGPLRALWLHSSLRDAAMKTARSLEEPLWGGLWRIEQDRTVATLSVGGADIATGDFVASQDPQAQERIRSAAHVLVCEEPLASLVRIPAIVIAQSGGS